MSTHEKSGVASLPAIQKMAQSYDLNAAAFIYTFKATAMPDKATDAEFVSCCLVAREHALNPLTKEIYFMKTRSGAIQPIVSVDGWIKKCNDHPQFDGIEFGDVNDDKGNLVAMSCSIHRKDRARPTTITEYFDECSKSGGAAWKTSPRRMMRNRVLCQCARIAFGFAGIMEPDEFAQWQGGMKDITPVSPSTPDIPDIPDEIPDIPEVQTSDETHEEPDTIADVAGFLKMIRDRLKEGYSPADIYESFGDMAERLPEDARGQFEAMLDDA